MVQQPRLHIFRETRTKQLDSNNRLLFLQKNYRGTSTRNNGLLLLREQNKEQAKKVEQSETLLTSAIIVRFETQPEPIFFQQSSPVDLESKISVQRPLFQRNATHSVGRLNSRRNRNQTILRLFKRKLIASDFVPYEVVR